jgi:serine/threonine protein kinase
LCPRNLLTVIQDVNGQPKVDEFVLKTYRSADDISLYRQEVEMFKALNSSERETPEIIKCFGSFRQRGTFNLILEFANGGSLLDLFQNSSPPIRVDELLRFWASMFELSKGLRFIHELSPTLPDGSTSSR